MMWKIKEINSYVRVTLDKLSSIRADLIHLDDKWQEWGFPQMLEALQKWCNYRNMCLDRTNLVVTRAYRQRRKTDSLTRGSRIGSQHHVCTLSLTNTSLPTVTRKWVWHKDRGTSETKKQKETKSVSTALVQGSEPLSVISSGAVRNVEACITLIRDQEPQKMLLTTSEGVVISPAVNLVIALSAEHCWTQEQEACMSHQHFSNN